MNDFLKSENKEHSHEYAQYTCIYSTERNPAEDIQLQTIYSSLRHPVKFLV